MSFGQDFLENLGSIFRGQLPETHTFVACVFPKDAKADPLDNNSFIITGIQNPEVVRLAVRTMAAFIAKMDSGTFETPYGNN